MNKLGEKIASLKTGDEKIIYNDTSLSFSLLDFWQWSVSDILSNTTRGRFAEFIVATATKINIKKARSEWSAYDLETPDGIKLEIKSAAYLQVWAQKQLSKITFSIKTAIAWDEGTDSRTINPIRHADLYVFCLLHHTDKSSINPLDLNQWEFYILSTKQINALFPNQKSITLNSLRRLTRPVNYLELEREIRIKNSLNTK